MARLAECAQLEFSRIGECSWDLANGIFRVVAPFAARHWRSGSRSTNALGQRHISSSRDAAEIGTAEILDGKVNWMHARSGGASPLSRFVAAAASICSACCSKPRRSETINVEFFDACDLTLKFAIESLKVARGISTSTAVQKWA